MASLKPNSSRLSSFYRGSCSRLRFLDLCNTSAYVAMVLLVQLPAYKAQATESNELALPQVEILSSPDTVTPPPASNLLLDDDLPSGNPALSDGYPTVDSYVLGAGDKVRLEIFRLPDYSREYEVLINGALNLPLVGQVVVSGLTLEQSEQAISQAYAQRLRRPIIDLFLVEPRPLRVGIAGEISQPGEYILQREGTQFPSLVNALETAGGITQSADLRQVVIQRPGPAGTKRTIVADLWQFLKTGDLRHNTALRDGDTVFIPTRGNFDSDESLQLAAASFAADSSQPLNVAVVGEVFRPGPHVVSSSSSGGGSSNAGSRRPPTVTQAIQTAGGIQPDANIREVQIYRRTRDGSQQVVAVNLWQLLTDGDITEDIAFLQCDVFKIGRAHV